MPSRPIHQILSDRPFVGVSADTPVREVVRQMNALQRSAALVTEHGVLTGIFTERDAAFGVLAAGLVTVLLASGCGRSSGGAESAAGQAQPPAAPSSAATSASQRLVVISNDEVVGHLEVSRSAGLVNIDYAVDNNGRGPKVKETLELDERGFPLHWHIQGSSLFGAAVAVFGNNLPDRLKANVLSVQGWISIAFLAWAALGWMIESRRLRRPSVTLLMQEFRRDYRRNIHRYLDEMEVVEKPVVMAIDGMCLGLGLAQGRQEHAGEDGDNGNHHQQLDQGKARLQPARTPATPSQTSLTATTAMET